MSHKRHGGHARHHGHGLAILGALPGGRLLTAILLLLMLCGGFK